MLEEKYKELIVNIKNDILSTRYKIMRNANVELINLYFRLGKILDDNYDYGNRFIDEVAKEIKREFPDLKGFSIRNLKYMKMFYIEYKDDEVVQQVVAQLPWET